jgi:hypothetical protein
MSESYDIAIHLQTSSGLTVGFTCRRDKQDSNAYNHEIYAKTRPHTHAEGGQVQTVLGATPCHNKTLDIMKPATDNSKCATCRKRPTDSGFNSSQRRRCLPEAEVGSYLTVHLPANYCTLNNDVGI